MINEAVKDLLDTSEGKKIATRQAYGEKLVELGEKRSDVVVMDCDLSKSTKTAMFARKFPERFFNMGIAESNMMSAAAGLAAMGKIPFISTFSVFAVKRACDQASISVAYPRLNVKICATHSGITLGEDGATHQAVEDVAIMRAMPNMTVISPADASETASAIEEVAEYEGPCYVRLCRGGSPVIFNDSYRFRMGRGIKIMDGDAATLISAGFTTHIAMDAARALQEEGIEVDLINMSSIKPIDEDMIIESAAKTGLVVTVEDHSVIGGLGGAVCELLSARKPVKVIRLGIQDKFGVSGSPAELIRAYGFDSQAIAAAVRDDARKNPKTD